MTTTTQQPRRHPVPNQPGYPHLTPTRKEQLTLVPPANVNHRGRGQQYYQNSADAPNERHKRDRTKASNASRLLPSSALNQDRVCQQHYRATQQQQQQRLLQQQSLGVRVVGDTVTPTPPPEPPWILDAELQFHIRHCPCSCDHLGFGNYLDYQLVDGVQTCSHRHRETSFSDGGRNVLQPTSISGAYHPGGHLSRRAAAKDTERKENGMATSHSRQQQLLPQKLHHRLQDAVNSQEHQLHYTTPHHNQPPSHPSHPSHQYTQQHPSTILQPSHHQSATNTPKHSITAVNPPQKTPTRSLSTSVPYFTAIDHVPVPLSMNISRDPSGVDLRSLRRSRETIGAFGSNGSLRHGQFMESRDGFRASSTFGPSTSFGPTSYYYDDYQLTPLDSCSCSTDGSDGSSTSDRETIVRGPWCICLVVCIVVATLAAGLGLPLALNPQQQLDATRGTPEERMIVVKRLLKDAPLIDGHNDLPWNIRKFTHNRITHLNLSSIHNQTPWSNSQWSHTDIPRLRAGLLGAQFWSAYVPCKSQHMDAVQLTLEQIDVIRRLVELNSQHLALVETVGEIREIHKNGRIASLIGVEGGHALGNSLAVLRTFYNLGARYLTITHSCDTPWAQGASIKTNGVPSNLNSLLTGYSIDSDTSTGLSPFGHSVIREMNRLGMIIDLSHTSINTARAVLNISHAPVIFSHSSAYSLCNSSRNVPDDVLKLVAHNGGVVMVNFYTRLVTCNETASMQDVVNHINHIRTVAGVEHVGLGAGYDGINMTPTGLEDVSRYPHLLVELLADPQWSPQDIALLAGQNLLRVFSQVEIIRDAWKRAAVQPGEDHAPPPPPPLTACRSIYNS